MDHNPLLAIFGADKSLEAIHNPRLLNSPIMNTPSRLPVDWTTQTNVGYADHLGQPSWVSQPTMAALTNSVDDLLMGYTVACIAEVNSNRVSLKKSVNLKFRFFGTFNYSIIKLVVK